MAVSKPRGSHERSPHQQMPHERMPVEQARDDVGPGSSRSAESVEAPTSQTSSGRLVGAVVVFGVWAVALIVLAMLTSNPVSLNRAQIIAAEVVVEAVYDAEEPHPRGGKHWQVKRSWPVDRTGASLEIDGLDGLPLTDGQSYLIPIEPVAKGRWRIVLSPQPFATPLVYPANLQTVTELEAILRESEPDRRIN